MGSLELSQHISAVLFLPGVVSTPLEPLEDYFFPSSKNLALWMTGLFLQPFKSVKMPERTS